MVLFYIEKIQLSGNDIEMAVAQWHNRLILHLAVRAAISMLVPVLAAPLQVQLPGVGLRNEWRMAQAPWTLYPQGPSRRSAQLHMSLALAVEE